MHNFLRYCCPYTDFERNGGRTQRPPTKIGRKIRPTQQAEQQFFHNKRASIQGIPGGPTKGLKGKDHREAPLARPAPKREAKQQANALRRGGHPDKPVKQHRGEQEEQLRPKHPQAKPRLQRLLHSLYHSPHTELTKTVQMKQPPQEKPHRPNRKVSKYRTEIAE